MTTTNDRRRRTSASVVSSSESRFPRALVLALFMMRGGVSGGFETVDESGMRTKSSSSEEGRRSIRDRNTRQHRSSWNQREEEEDKEKKTFDRFC